MNASGTLVLGLGNPLMTDDGAGLALLERIGAGWEMPPEVRLADGGTLGLALLPLIMDAAQVLLLDAIEAGLPAGAPVELDRDQVPRRYQVLTSAHQILLSEVLAAAELLGRLPPVLAAVGVQPGVVELGYGLSPAASAGLDAAAKLAVARLATWGHSCRQLEPVCTS